MKNKKLIGLSIITIAIIGIILAPNWQKTDREEFIHKKETIVGEMLADGQYKCCLEEPCTYCIEKSPGHGEDAACKCLEDVVNGKHPCGECIGEILEGHGNQYLSKYFAQAIAEETGHKETLKKIMSEKYNITMEEQI